MTGWLISWEIYAADIGAIPAGQIPANVITDILNISRGEELEV
ncbi:hypothetical protein [Mucilaginibacter humi]|nr:hypothetical protein [Mucilaginibacter humi]